MNDELLFAEDLDEDKVEYQGTWKVLIVDDEPEIHAVTKLALNDFEFQNKNLEFLSAYNGQQARDILLKDNDIAVVLLDVVMETDDAGLKIADFIRNEAENHFIRIILRTGQPGQAPERDVIINYDINDYKSKTELTAQKLFTVVIAALRSYRDIVAINENRKGLEKIISASADLFRTHSMESFIEGIVQQLSSLLGGGNNAAYLTCAVAGPRPFSGSCTHSLDNLVVFTGQGEYQSAAGKALPSVLSGEQLDACRVALKDKSLVYADEYLVAYCESHTQCGSLLYLSGLPKRLTDAQKKLVEIFSQNVQIAFDNIMLTKDIEDTQREIIERLGQAMEEGSAVGSHIQRTVKICQILGQALELDEEQLRLLTSAVPLHDVGNLYAPTHTLFKTDKLSTHDIDLIAKNTKLGYRLLKDSKRPLIQVAATIAKEHHEHWNGKGHPYGLHGENIHLFSRIASIAIAYNVMRSATQHQDAWPVPLVLARMQELSGSQFDPNLVAILSQNIDKIEDVTLDCVR
ncbi:response regulator [Paraglaciecola polaris]|uniref:Response regulator n=1 Tax=Paraglaciecola polaris LMG 21857 TaxID=1129793 RepID=K7A191_9ALTE|nr:response regulator [Paraglaciecola polaris]GAC34713.1 response regulator [Paraglaciecola polaris LMG 21857]